MLFKHGCKGTSEKLDFSQPGFSYEPVVEEQKNIHLICYFGPFQKEAVAPVLQDWVWRNAPDATIQWVIQRERDWLSEWKKNFKPFRLAGLKITPSWCVSKKDKISKTIVLNPGMAFGTGHHATTKFAIEQLYFLKRKGKVKNSKVLDVGAGTGILSVVAERFGAKSVVAVDNDAGCWREARKTFRLNKTKKCKVSKLQVEKIKSTSDLVVANIIDGILLHLRDHLWRLTKKEGYIILSGILGENSHSFINSFCENQKCDLVNKLADGEWVSYLLKKL